MIISATLYCFYNGSHAWKVTIYSQSSPRLIYSHWLYSAVGSLKTNMGGGLQGLWDIHCQLFNKENQSNNVTKYIHLHKQEGDISHWDENVWIFPQVLAKIIIQSGGRILQLQEDEGELRLMPRGDFEKEQIQQNYWERKSLSVSQLNCLNSLIYLFWSSYPWSSVLWAGMNDKVQKVQQKVFSLKLHLLMMLIQKKSLDIRYCI